LSPLLIRAEAPKSIDDAALGVLDGMVASIRNFN
jgi:hypothetical protein